MEVPGASGGGVTAGGDCLSGDCLCAEDLVGSKAVRRFHIQYTARPSLMASSVLARALLCFFVSLRVKTGHLFAG